MTPQQVYDKHRGPSDPPWEALPAVARRGWAVAARSQAHPAQNTPSDFDLASIRPTGAPMSQPKPVFDILTCTYGEALAIYLYAHRQIEDVRDVGQAEVIRTKVDARIEYITRGADSEHREWEITPSVDEFAFELQQTLARYAAGLIDAEIRGTDYDDR